MKAFRKVPRRPRKREPVTVPVVPGLTRRFSAVVEKEGAWYVALCPEVDVASQGRTIEEALHNLKEAVGLYLTTASPKEIQSTLSSPPLITTLEVAV
jgi:predicted RNase H-like HicB family nuclease